MQGVAFCCVRPLEQNTGEQPRLTGFCDWNGCHRNVLGSWKEVKDRFATLPEFTDRGM